MPLLMRVQADSKSRLQILTKLTSNEVRGADNTPRTKNANTLRCIYYITNRKQFQGVVGVPSAR